MKMGRARVSAWTNRVYDRMRKAAVLMITVLVILVIIGGVILQSMLIFQRIAVVRITRGEVMVRARKHTDFQAIGDAERLFAGDTVRTGSDGHLRLEWIDGTRLSVDPNTELTILKCRMNKLNDAETSVFKLDTGGIWIRIIKVLNQKSKFEVRTPTATAGVRGTVFSVRVDEQGQTEVSVFEGSVAVNSEDVSETIGERNVARVQESGVDVAGFDPTEQQIWEQNRDVAAPILAIEAPEEGFSAKPGETVIINGQTEPDAKVTVGGEPVEPKIKHRFSAEVTVPEDYEKDTLSVPVEVTDRRGFVAREEIKVTVRH